MRKKLKKLAKNIFKSQGSIEYLLLIGVAILIVIVAMIAVTSILSTSGANANNNVTQLETGYQGFYDIMDKSLGRVKVILKFLGGQENWVEFQSLPLSNKVSAIFSDVPIGTILTIPSCAGFNDSPLTATKTSEGWSPDISKCDVPIGQAIMILPPSDSAVSLSVDETKKPVTIITTEADFSKLKDSPTDTFEINDNVNISQTIDTEFSGVLEGGGTITLNCGDFEACFPVFSNITNKARISNITINVPSNAVAPASGLISSNCSKQSTTNISVEGNITDNSGNQCILDDTIKETCLYGSNC